jgi:hypothetical protein
MAPPPDSTRPANPEPVASRVAAGRTAVLEREPPTRTTTAETRFTDDQGRRVERDQVVQRKSVRCNRCGNRIRIRTTAVTTTRRKVDSGFGADDIRKAFEAVGAAAPLVRDALKKLGAI